MNPSDNPIADAPITDVDADVQSYIHKHIVLFILLGVLAIGFVWLGIYTTYYNIFFALAGIVLFLSFTVVFLKARAEFMEQVAAALGFTYEKIGLMDSVAGQLFDLGHTKSIKNIISGKYQDLPLRIYNYQTVVGYGKSSQTLVFTVFEIDYGCALPHIILKSKEGWADRAFDVSARVPDSFSGDISMKLEGDFPEHFVLNTEKGLEIETLEIFTPDIMTMFIDKSKGLNFELFGQKMYVYKSKAVGTKNDMAALYDTVTILMKALAPHFKEVTSDVTDMETLESVSKK